MAGERARSANAKEIKFKKIIEIGRDLFINQSEDGFSTSHLAEKIGIKQASLYKYIESKRDLWFAIVIHDLDEIQQDLQRIETIHNGSYMDLIFKMMEYYFDIAINDYSKIRLLYRTDAPNSNKIGPYERQYNPAGYYSILLRVIQNAIKQNELKVDDPMLFMFYLFSTIHGATLLVGERGFKQDPQKFKHYTIAQIKNMMVLYQNS